MNRNIREYLKLLWQSVLFWTVSLAFYSIYRYYGVAEDITQQTNVVHESVFELSEITPFYMLSGFMIGILYATVEFIYEKFTSKRMSLGANLLIQTIVYFLFLVAIFTSVINLASQIYDVNVDVGRGWWLKDKSFWASMLYVMASSITFSFIRIAKNKFGRGILVKMLLGRYKNPQEEKHIFMFLDLRSSTAIAEQLGHLKYSQFIQDCFYDLNEIIPKYEAEIYQYVGDEAVLTWDYKKGLANNNCVALFFEFQRLLHSKSDYYMNKYRTVPEFKAGLHGGTLMAAEVGVIKKELAYHGDVINTTARIQALCNKYRQKLIISEELLNTINLNSIYEPIALGKLLLKGKQQKLNLLGLKETA